MGVFFSNKQRLYVNGQSTKTLFNERSLSYIINLGCIHICVRDEEKVYDGRFDCEKDGTLIFISYDGLIIISVTIVGNKVLNIGFHRYNEKNLSASVVYEQEIDYNDVYGKIERKKISDDEEYIAVRRDRGRKVAILTRPKYDVNGILELYNNDLQRFDSYYLTWLKFYTLGQDFELPILTSVLKSMQDVNMLDRVMLADRMQCLGIALCLSELADRFSINMFMPDYETIMSYLVEYAFFAIMIYLATYKGVDSLKDAELYAIQGRLCYLQKSRLVAVLMNCGITNTGLIDDMYVCCMYLASQCSPNIFLKTEYFKNMLMMHQNQTLANVTKDSMDESFHDSVNNGISCMNQLVDKMPELYKSGRLSIPEIVLQNIDSGKERIIQSSLKDLSRNYIKSFCLIHQINPYYGQESANILLPGRVKCKLDKFLRNIGVIRDVEDKLKRGGLNKILLKNGFDCHVYSNIYSISVLFDDKNYLQAVYLRCTNSGYELKKEIDRIHLFYGFVCETSFCDFGYSPQTIALLPFIINHAV